MALTRKSEFGLIDAFVAAFARTGARVSGGLVRVGPGDDCAVLAPEKNELCVTTDAVVENVHFNRRTFSFEDIGHKALAVNLSDLASMGARPGWFVCAIASPKSLSASEIRRLARGMGALAKLHDITLVGGNFTGASELSITLTAAGTVAAGKALLRSGARNGDLLYVSGTLGDAAVGLDAGRSSKRQRRPEPRVELGLLAREFASAAIDISDGFAQDLGHLCEASRLRAIVGTARLPRSSAVRRLGDEGVQLALSGGEDYELILAIPAQKARAFEAACSRRGQVVTRVGAFTRGRGVQLVDAKGAPLPTPRGFDHFR
ncbi:MAG: thiamine-phosphate kinase [Myxococcaceae bacterium]